MKLTILIPFTYILLTATDAFSQPSKETYRGASGFAKIINADIPGAPELQQPILIKGIEGPIVAQGHGLAAPAFYDWNGDGLKDLLIGEFGSGIDEGKYMGNFIRVYINTGSESAPEFSGRFDYARPPFEIPTNGTPYSVDQFCCIGFTPQFSDLNGDGQLDMITGQYYGEVSWFERTEEGFMDGQRLQQAGDPRQPQERKRGRQFYWLYSSASFGDFTGDGKVDMIVGGPELRLSKNIGTQTAPVFAERQPLLDVNGQPLKVHDFNADELKFYEDRKMLGYVAPAGGDEKLSPYVTDWDNDGVLDLLVTNSYSHRGLSAITFFKGTVVNSEYRFRPGVALVTADVNGIDKLFPGSTPHIFVTDWNNDGINDLLIGAAVLTLKNEFIDNLSWGWEDDYKILCAGKDPANVELSGLLPIQQEGYWKDHPLPEGMTQEEYMTMRHQGYIYVALGQKRDTVQKIESKKEKAKRKK